MPSAVDGAEQTARSSDGAEGYGKGSFSGEMRWMGSPEGRAAVSLIHNERTKLTAAYLNAGAASCLAAGVVAPVAAALLGVTGAAGSLTPFDSR